MSESSYKPGIHKFLDDFIKHYMTKKDFRESLVVSLATVYVAKCEGVPTLSMVQKYLIFSCLYVREVERHPLIFSSDLCAVSLRHQKVLCARRRTKLFVGLDWNDSVTRLCDHMVEICKQRRDPDSCVIFTTGFDGTILVGWW